MRPRARLILSGSRCRISRQYYFSWPQSSWKNISITNMKNFTILFTSLFITLFVNRPAFLAWSSICWMILMFWCIQKNIGSQDRLKKVVPHLAIKIPTRQCKKMAEYCFFRSKLYPFQSCFKEKRTCENENQWKHGTEYIIRRFWALNWCLDRCRMLIRLD